MRVIVYTTKCIAGESRVLTIKDEVNTSELVVVENDQTGS